MLKFLNAFAAFLTAAFWAGAGAADITRHCEASIAFHPIEVRTSTGIRTLAEGHGAGYAPVRIVGRGRCGGHQANRCRDRAKDAMLKCAREIWDMRWTPAATNAKCAANLDSSRPPNAAIKSWNAPASRGDIKRAMEQIACCEKHPNAVTVSGPVKIHAYFNDNRRCRPSSAQVLSTVYVAKCRQLRRDGLCGYQRSNPR